MASTRREKGKLKVGESSEEPVEVEQQTPSIKSLRMDFDFRNRSLMLVKYCKLSTFPEHSFNFHELLKYQGIDSLVYDCGAYHLDLVKDFYANMNFGTGEFGDPTFTSKVKNMEISMDLESFGTTVGIPTAGVSLRQGYQPDSDGWETYSKMEYFFEICRGS